MLIVLAKQVENAAQNKKKQTGMQSGGFYLF